MWQMGRPLVVSINFIIQLECSSAENRLDRNSKHGIDVVIGDGVFQQTSFRQCLLQHGEDLQLLVGFQSQNLLHHLLWTYCPV